MRNCATDGCPACHGSLDTKGPAFEDATEKSKADWYDCRHKAMSDDFEASEAAYEARTCEDLELELVENKKEEARLVSLIDEGGDGVNGKVDYKKLFKGDMQKGIDIIRHQLARVELMTTQQELNRWIGWKINGIPEDAYRNDEGRVNPYRESSVAGFPAR